MALGSVIFLLVSIHLGMAWGISEAHIDPITNQSPLTDTAAMDEIIHRIKESTDQVLKQRLQRAKEMYKLNVAPTPHRARRAIPDQLTQAYEGFYELTSIQNITDVNFPDCLDVESFTANSLHFVVTIQHSLPNARTVFYQFNTFPSYQNVTEIQSIDTAGAKDLAIFHAEGQTMLIIMESNSETVGVPTGTVVYQFNQDSSRFQYIQRIQTHNPTKVEVFHMNGQDYAIFVGAFVETFTGGIQRRVSGLYRWKGGHLDRISTFVTGNALDVHPFKIHSQVFLALANRTDSHILLFNPHLEIFVRYQDIAITDAVDWEYFYLGDESKDQDHFLAVASGVDGPSQSVIYKFHRNEFVPFQSVPTTGARLWHAVTNTNGTLRILALASQDGISFFHYDGWKFEKLGLAVPPLLPGSDLIRSMESFMVDDEVVLFVADNSTLERNAFTLEFLEQTSIWQLHRDVAASCISLRSEVTSLDRRLQSLTSASDNLVYANSEDVQVVTGNKTFPQNVTMDTVSVNEIHAEKGMILDAWEKVDFSELKSNQSRSFVDLTSIEEQLARTVRKTGPRQIITGPKTFTTINATYVQANTVNVPGDVINQNVNLSELVTNTWYKDADQSVDVAFSIAGNVAVLADLDIAETLDGINPSDIVTLSRNHVIQGSKAFYQPTHFKGNLNVSQSIDGVEFTEANLLLTYGSQAVRGHMNVSGVVSFSDSVAVDGLVDGCDLSIIGQDAVLTMGNFIVTGNKILEGDVTPRQGIRLGPSRTIDGVNILSLNATAMKTTGVQTLTGNYHFTKVGTIDNIDVSGYIDGLSIPDDILMEDWPTETILTGTWTFSDNVTMSTFTAQTSVDGILATGQGTGLDILLKDARNQMLEGAIVFAGGLGLWASSEVDTGIVDGVNIQAALSNAVFKTGRQWITGEKVYASDVGFRGNLLVEGYVNGINVTRYESTAVKLFGEGNALVLNGHVEITASETKMAGPLITGGSHSFPYRRSIYDLVHQGEQDVIYGSKSFSGVSSDTDVVATTANGINVTRFFEESLRVVPGVTLVVDGNVTFWDDVKIEKDLKIQSQFIDGIYIPDIVTIDNDSYVASTTTFTSDITARDLYLNVLQLSGLLNNYDIEYVYGNTLKTSTSGNQQVTGGKTFLNGLAIDGDLVVTGNTNSFDLSAVAEDAVYINHAHTSITAEKVFNCLMDVTHLIALDHVDGVRLPSFSVKVVKQGIPQTIGGAVQFMQDVRFDNNVTVAKAVNGYSITADLLRILNVVDSYYDGEMQFSDVVSGDAATLSGFIDGFQIGDFVLKESEFQMISGQKRFLGSLASQSSMIALLINGVSIDNLNAVAAKLNEAESIKGNITFASGVSLEQHLSVTTLVDTVDVRNLEGNVLMNDGRVKVFEGNGILGDIIVHGDMIFNGTIDGVDLEELGRTYMSRSLPQTVTGNKTFQDTVTIGRPGFIDALLIQLGGKLNGVDLERFAQSVWVDGRGDEVSDIKTFTKMATLASLTIGGTINGLDLTAEAMLTDGDNTVTGWKTFTGSPLTVNGAINMKDWKGVDGVDLSEYKRTAVTILDDYNITQPTSFARIILQNNLFVDGEIDGVKVERDSLLLTVGPQEVTGAKTFSQDFRVASNITINGLLNGVDLVDLFQNTLLISPNQTVVGDYVFTSPMTVGNVTTEANVDGLRIPELYRHVYTYPSFTRFSDILQLRCDAINRMHAAQEYAAVLLAHLVVSQVIDTVGYLTWHAFYYNDVQWMVAAHSTTYPDTSCIASDIYQWNETTGDYEYYQSLYPKSTVDMDSFVLHDRLFLVLAGKHNDTGQCDNFPHLYDGDDVDGIVTQNRTSIPGSFFSYSTTNVLVWLPLQESFYLYQALPCVSPSDVEVFVDPLSNQTCVAIANEAHITSDVEFVTVLPSYVYCLESLADGFYLKDTFSTSGASKIRHFFKDGILHLAVANRISDVLLSFSTESVIFQQTSNGTFAQLVAVDSTAASDILAVTIEGNSYIILANEFTGTLNDPDYDRPVHIYRFSDASTLFLEQQLTVFGVKSLGHFSTEDQFYLLIVDQLATTLYEFKGIDLFVKVHTMTTYGATSLYVFPLGDSGLYQVAVAAYSEEDLFFDEQFVHALSAPSLILEFVLIGERIPSSGCSSEERLPGGLPHRDDSFDDL